MTYHETGSAQVVLMAFVAIAGAIALIAFPAMISSPWNILGWLVVVAAGVGAGVLKHKESQKKLIEQKKLEKQRRKRSEHLKKEKLEKEKKIETLRENLAKNEEKKAEKWTKIKADLVKESGAVWAGRVEHAQHQENLVRKIIKDSKHMPVRNAAGQLAILWNETSTLAQWTAKQIVMFSQRPNATTKAREEAQEAIIEAAQIRENGGMWTKEKGLKLAQLKEKAREEAKIEEKRLEAIKDVIENAEIKWRSSSTQIRRWQEELDSV